MDDYWNFSRVVTPGWSNGMVTNVTSLTGNGLKDWLLQRLSAIYFGIYCLFLVGFVLYNRHLEFNVWANLFQSSFFKVASIIAIFTFLIHTWIGIWTVTTDYIKCTSLRVFIQTLVALVLFAQLLWGVMIFWGQ